MRYCLHVFAPLLVFLLMAAPLHAQFPHPDSFKEEPVEEASTTTADAHDHETDATANTFAYPAFQVFDNLHYIGIGWVAAWLVKTSDGLVLLDTLYAEHVDPMFDKIRALGFDPADIRYAFVTHGHFDHCGGAARVKEVTGARIGMTAKDWAMFAADADGSSGLPGFPTIPTDLVIADEEQITLGDTTFTFYETPGHTPGVLSMSFPVRDGDAEHKAFMFGGTGLNFSGADRTQMFIDSVDRILAMEGLEVNIPNHAPMGDVFGRRDRLADRLPGDPHPFVDPEDFQKRLTEQRAKAVEKLKREKAKEVAP